MLTIIAHLTMFEGNEALFEVYERQALDVFREHGGEVVLVTRPTSRMITPEELGADAAHPREIHVLRIATREQFEKFRTDPRMVALAAVRSAAVARTELFFCEDAGDL